MHSVLVAGHICVDITPALAGTPRIVPGGLMEIGAPAFSLGGCVGNTGVALIESGVPTSVDAILGDDELGAIAMDLLRRTGIESSRISKRAGQSTSYSIIIQPPQSDRTIWHDPGANLAFDPRNVDLTGVDLLHIGYPPLLPGALADDGEPLRDLLRRARELGITTSMDLAVVDPDGPAAKVDWARFFESTLQFVDVISPSFDDIASALGTSEPVSALAVERATARLLDQGAAVVAMSAGEHGMLVRTAPSWRMSTAGSALAPAAADWADFSAWLPSAPLDAFITTNGAGDAATAGFLHGIATGAGPQGSAILATRFAAIVISGRRPTPASIADHEARYALPAI